MPEVVFKLNLEKSTCADFGKRYLRQRKTMRWTVLMCRRCRTVKFEQDLRFMKDNYWATILKRYIENLHGHLLKFLMIEHRIANC